MNTPTEKELQYLFEKRDRFCVSIFLPTRKAGMVREIEEGRIRLKDLLHDANSRLAAAGLGKTETTEMLAPVQQLLERSQFWRRQNEGLALFAAPGFFKYFSVPYTLPELVTVADRFDITPLLPLWTSEEQYYLLALSLKQARVFQGTRYGISELDVKDLPQSLPEVLEYALNQSTRQQHTLKAGLPEDALRYFREMDKALHESIKNQRVPLVLAGVEEAVSLYRQTNTYPLLLEESVLGSPDRMKADELHAHAQPIVHRYYHRRKKQAIEEFQECLDPARVSKELKEILPAASEGRIFHLFVPADTQRWGYFDSEHDVVFVHDKHEVGDEDLLNLAAVQTILHGGSVYTLDSSEMPEGTSVAALFRYKKAA